MNRDLYTSEVAARLRVAARSVRLWCARGLFPNAYEEETPRGSVWRIPEKDLEAFRPPKMGRPRTRNLASDDSTVAERAA